MSRLANSVSDLQAILNGGVPVQRGIVTPGQLEEAEKVRGMQVRTQAGMFATQLLATKAPSMERWLKTATVIENYILGQPQTEVPPATAGRPSVG
jgi:hypothetical protein